MWRALRAVCVVFTASVVLFALINLVVAYRYPRDTRAVLSGHPVFNEAMRAIYERIYQLPISVVREIIAEGYMENAWIFEPYVQFRERPREGRFVNISSDGFRLNSSNDRKSWDPTRSASVFTFGGSTMFGYGVRDEDTIAAHLEALLRRDLPGDAPVRVYNFGRAYYGSSQEFLLLKSLVQRGMVPKVAVFMDGVNEHLSFCPVYSANMAEVFKIIQQDPAAKLREVIASLPIMRLATSPYRSELVANAMYVNRALTGYPFECRCSEEATCHTQLLRTYRLNKHLIQTMAKDFDFEVHFVLQPVGGYRNRFTTSPEGTKRPDFSALVRYYERETMNGTNDHSLSGILEAYQGEAFVDIVHYTTGVNRLIAERIHPSVVRALAKSATVTSARAAPATTQGVESEIHLAEDPATVFSYFTDSARLVRWMGRSARIRPVRDGEFYVQMSEDTSIRGTFLELDPSRRLALAWRWESVNTGLPAGPSRVDVSLTPREGGTLVRVVHSSLPSLVASRHHEGWTHYLTRLSIVVGGRDPGADTWFTAVETSAGRTR
jgi:uncharacterized protein YndB with AHSA1/START domain